MSHSPPPGRPGQESSRDKRGRESSSGSESGQNVAKLAKQVEPDETWRETVEKADLVSEAAISPSGEKGSMSVPDLGSFTSVQGTPSKKNPSLEFVQSPIISKNEKKQQI